VRSVGEVSKDCETFEARAALAADARSVSVARRLLAQLLDAGGVRSNHRSDAPLLLSELIANAIRHGSRPGHQWPPRSTGDGGVIGVASERGAGTVERAKLEGRLGSESDSSPVICKCAETACTTLFEISPTSARVQQHPHWFIVARGHDGPSVEHVVEEHRRFGVNGGGRVVAVSTTPASRRR
jgi:hypothetical protein